MISRVVQQLVHKLLVDLVRDDVKAMLPGGSAKPIPTEAFVQFIAGAFFGLLIWWLNEKKGLSVEDLNALFRRIAIPAVKTSLG